jgi:MFS family permease
VAVDRTFALPRRRLPAGRLGAPGEREFRRLWLGQAVSALGDGMVPVALAFAVIELTGSASDLGLVFVAVLVPRLALVLVGGVWADRLRRQRVMLAADAVRCVTQGLIAVALMAETAQLWQLLVLSALYGGAGAFFSPAATGLVPETVRPDRLQQANALMGLTRSVSLALGPAVGGALVATAGPGWAFAVDSATFAVSAWFLARLRLPHAARAVERASFFTDLGGGWREATARTWVWASILYFGVWNLAVAAVFVLGPFVAEDSLGGASSWGLIVASAGAGSLLGGVLALRLRPRRPLAVGFLATGLCALEPALLARPSPTATIALAAALGFGGAAFSDALWFTVLQERIPRGAISRVSAYDWMGSIAFKPIGYALVGPLVAGLGTSSTLILSAVLLAASSAAIAAVPSVRRVRGR